MRLNYCLPVPPSLLLVVLLKMENHINVIKLVFSIYFHRLQQELEALKTSWDSQVAQISRETVSKDLQIQALQQEEVKLRAQLSSILQDIER